MIFEYFSDFLLAVSGVGVRTEVKEEDVFGEDEGRRDGPGVLIYNANILSLPYSAEHPTIPEYEDSEEDDERALRILKIIEVVSASPLISNIELPTLTGVEGGDYGGGDSVGINGNYYERMIAEKLAEALSKRSDFSLSFEISVLGGRLCQACRFVKDIHGDINVYHADQSNCSHPLEFSYGPFHCLEPDKIQYRISSGKVGKFLGFDDDDGPDEDGNEREVVGADLAAAASARDEDVKVSVGREKEDHRVESIAERIRKRRRSESGNAAQDTPDLKRQRQARDTALQAGSMPRLSHVKRKRSATVLSGQSSNQRGRKKLKN